MRTDSISLSSEAIKACRDLWEMSLEQSIYRVSLGFLNQKLKMLKRRMRLFPEGTLSSL